MAIKLIDLLRTALGDLNDSLAQANSDAQDAEDDSVLWNVVYELEDAVDSVERALKSVPQED